MPPARNPWPYALPGTPGITKNKKIIMSDTTNPLQLDLVDNGAFPAIDEAEWRSLVEDGLKGADFDRRLVKKTADGLNVQPLYGPGAAADDSGLPGQAPFTRGAQAATELIRPWDLVLRVDEPDLKTANAIILEGLERGISHLELVLGDHAAPGLEINDVSDMEALLAGVDLALISISVRGGEASGGVAGMIARVGGPKVVRGSIGLDPLGCLATRGGLTKPLEEALAEAAYYALKTSEMTDTFRTMSVDMRGYDASGASPALSLGMAMATGTAYLRALEAGGLSIDDAAKQISFVLTTDTDLFVSVAKLRAARTLWSRIVTASGGSEEAAAMALTAETASSMMTRRDPHTNILRTAIAGFGAALGGADKISILPFTHALGLPNELARRVARNIHVLLAEESNLGRVMDPAGGSFALESLTDDVAKAAWAQFQDIETSGGMGAALTSARIQDQLEGLVVAELKDIATRKISVTGVSEFADIEEGTPEVTVRKQPDVAVPSFAVEARILRARRLAEPFEDLRDRADKAAKRPKVFLANIGTLAAYTARANFTRSFFEAGGFEVIDGDGGTNENATVDAFTKSGADIACLCSSDPLYKEHAVITAKALRSSAKGIFYAGRPGDHQKALENAGVVNFVFTGTDVLYALRQAQKLAGV